MKVTRAVYELYRKEDTCLIHCHKLLNTIKINDLFSLLFRSFSLSLFLFSRVFAS